MSSDTALTVPGWLSDLLALDRQTGGSPEVPHALLPDTREWLATILVDVADGLISHIRQLELHYGGIFRAPLSRCLTQICNPEWPIPDPHFPHVKWLNEQQLTALANCGLPALRDASFFPKGEPAELAQLLLNPYALFDLSDLITCSAPDAWHDKLDKSGQRLLSQYHFELPNEE